MGNITAILGPGLKSTFQQMQSLLSGEINSFHNTTIFYTI